MTINPLPSHVYGTVQSEYWCRRQAYTSDPENKANHSSQSVLGPEALDGERVEKIAMCSTSILTSHPHQQERQVFP